MSKLHKSSNGTKELEPKEGQRGLLCNNRVPYRCPSLDYKHISSSDKLDKAFDLLFEEVMKI